MKGYSFENLWKSAAAALLLALTAAIVPSARAEEYKGSENIEIDADNSIKLKENIKLTEDGSLIIGEEETATPGVHKAAGFTADRLGIAVSQDGKVSYGTGLTAKGVEVLDAGTGGKIAGASINTQAIGIAVSQDGKLLYGTGVTAKGIEIADNKAEKTNNVSYMTPELIMISKVNKNLVREKASGMVPYGFVAQSGPEDNPDKIVSLTTGTAWPGNYKAGLYIADATMKEHSVLTTSDLTVGNKTYIDKNGINANGQKITNAADGTIAQGSTDAVNGGQLWDTYSRTNNRIDGVITDVNNRFNEVHDDMSAVGSQSAAMSALQAVPYNPYAPTTITAGLGFYRSDQAVAVGVYHYIRDSVLLNVGGSFNLNGHGDAMARAGVSFAVGSGAGKGAQSVGRDMTEMQKTIAAMRNELETLRPLRSEVEELRAENAENKKILEENKKALQESMKIIEELKKAVRK